MSEVGFDPTTSAFKWAKTGHSLDRAATVIGNYLLLRNIKFRDRHNKIQPLDGKEKLIYHMTFLYSTFI
jgi:hypothetical protein